MPRKKFHIIVPGLTPEQQKAVEKAIEEQILPEFNDLVRAYHELESKIREERKRVREPPLQVKYVARGKYTMYPPDSDPIDMILTTDGELLSYGLLSKEEIARVQKEKGIGIAIGRVQDGENIYRTVVGLVEGEAPRLEAEIVNIRDDMKGNHFIHMKLSTGGEPIVKQYNPKVDKVKLNELKIGYKINIMPGTYDIMEVYKPVSELRIGILPKDKIERITFDDIGGLEKEIYEIYTAFVDPLLCKEGTKSMQNIILYGPPGCGKTMLGKALANSLPECGYIYISLADVVSKWFGESERIIKATFTGIREDIEQGKYKYAVVFIDEFEALAIKRAAANIPAEVRIVDQLNAEIEGLTSSKNVFAIASTNMPEIIDESVSNRFPLMKEIYPNKEYVKDVLKKYIQKIPYIDKHILDKFTGSETEKFKKAREYLLEYCINLMCTDEEVPIKLGLDPTSGQWITGNVKRSDVPTGRFIRDIFERKAMKACISDRVIMKIYSGKLSGEDEQKILRETPEIVNKWRKERYEVLKTKYTDASEIGINEDYIKNAYNELFEKQAREMYTYILSKQKMERTRPTRGFIT